MSDTDSFSVSFYSDHRSLSVQTLVDLWLDLVDPPEPEGEQPYYPYEIKTSQGFEQRRADDPTTVRQDLVDANGGYLGHDISRENKFEYDGLKIDVGISGGDMEWDTLIGIDFWFFSTGSYSLEAVEDHLTSLTDLMTVVHEEIESLFSFATGGNRSMRHVNYPRKQEVRDGVLTDVFWIQIYGSDLVATFGEQQLLAAPAHETRLLDDGSCLVVAHDDPLDPDLFARIETLREYLGIDAESE